MTFRRSGPPKGNVRFRAHTRNRTADVSTWLVYHHLSTCSSGQTLEYFKILSFAKSHPDRRCLRAYTPHVPAADWRICPTPPSRIPAYFSLFRKYAEPGYVQIYTKGEGLVEFNSKDEMDHVIKKLDDTKFHGEYIRLTASFALLLFCVRICVVSYIMCKLLRRRHIQATW